MSLLFKNTSVILNKFFEEKLDTNMYFYYQYKNQLEQKKLCSSYSGPFCGFLNKKSLTYNEDSFQYKGAKTKQIDPNENLVKEAKSNFMEEMFQSIKELDEYNKEGAGGIIFFPPSSTRHSLDLLKSRKNSGGVEYLIEIAKLDFELFPLKMENVLLKEFLSFSPYARQFNIHDAEKVTPRSIQREDNVIISFQDMYLPSERLVTVKGKEKKENKKEWLPKEEDGPQAAYLFTKEDQYGWIRFSKPVKIKHIFMRKHKFKKEDERKTAKSETSFYLESIGLVDTKLVHRFTYSAKVLPDFNKWVQVKGPQEENGLINALRIAPNTDIDNIIFEKKYKSNFFRNIMESLNKKPLNGLKTPKAKIEPNKNLNLVLQDLKELLDLQVLDDKAYQTFLNLISNSDERDSNAPHSKPDEHLSEKKIGAFSKKQTSKQKKKPQPKAP